MRHLAAMMGKNPDEFTFEDQQKAIRYLMPGELDPKPTAGLGLTQVESMDRTTDRTMDP